MTTAVTPMHPIQRAIYALLTGDTALTAMINGVFDHVPEPKAHPYVEIGEAIETPRNSHGSFGRETSVTLHTWTNARGFAEGDAIVTRLMQLLDHQPLTIDGQNHIATRYEFGQALRDPDPQIRHHVTRFRIVTEQQ